MNKSNAEKTKVLYCRTQAEGGQACARLLEPYGERKIRSGLQKRNQSRAGKLKKRLQGGGRPLIFEDLDIQLTAWFRERRSKKLCLSHTILQDEAVQMFNAEEDRELFKGSRRWLMKFLQRHNFRLRVPTTVCQKAPSDYVQKIVDFDV
uniref:HTH CENPB-type domain-containing protein n=1 Tax=Ditylenchus dipsaci TaxID=166011 RepID=A0A915DBX7_9BILA